MSMTVRRGSQDQCPYCDLAATSPPPMYPGPAAAESGTVDADPSHLTLGSLLLRFLTVPPAYDTERFTPRSFPTRAPRPLTRAPTRSSTSRRGPAPPRPPRPSYSNSAFNHESSHYSMASTSSVLSLDDPDAHAHAHPSPVPPLPPLPKRVADKDILLVPGAEVGQGQTGDSVWHVLSPPRKRLLVGLVAVAAAIPVLSWNMYLPVQDLMATVSGGWGEGWAVLCQSVPDCRLTRAASDARSVVSRTWASPSETSTSASPPTSPCRALPRSCGTRSSTGSAAGPSTWPRSPSA